MRLVAIALVAACAAAPAPRPVIAHAAPVQPPGATCLVRGRAFDAMTGEGVVGATIATAGGDAAISDEHGAFELDLRGARTVHVYYMNSDLVRNLSGVPCGGSFAVRFYFGPARFHKGSCEAYPDLIRVD